jgi:hypothetical protein
MCLRIAQATPTAGRRSTAKAELAYKRVIQDWKATGNNNTKPNGSLDFHAWERRLRKPRNSGDWTPRRRSSRRTLAGLNAVVPVLA